jgi:hypothetical protein
VLLFCVALISFLVFRTHGADPGICAEDKDRISDHFDGNLFINPGRHATPPLSPAEEPQRGRSGPSGNVFYSGDTGYGPHFREISQRFSPIRVAILPISPFRLPQSNKPPHRHYPEIHMGPAEAVQAHLDIRATLSIAAHFQVFQLGADGFDDALNELKSVLAERDLNPGAFIAPPPGQSVELTAHFDKMKGLANLQKAGENR